MFLFYVLLYALHLYFCTIIIIINTVVRERDSGHSEICGLKRLIIPSLSSEHLKVAYNTTFVLKISTTFTTAKLFKI